MVEHLVKVEVVIGSVPADRSAWAFEVLAERLFNEKIGAINMPPGPGGKERFYAAQTRSPARSQTM